MKNTSDILARIESTQSGLYLIHSSARAVQQARSIRGQIELLQLGHDEEERVRLETQLATRFQDSGFFISVHAADSLGSYFAGVETESERCWVSVDDPSVRGTSALDAAARSSDTLHPDAVLRRAVVFSETGASWASESLEREKEAGVRILSLSRWQCFLALNQVLVSRFPANGIRFLDDVGILAFLLPEVPLLKDFHRSSRFHHKDVYEHTLQVVAQAVPKATVRWAALLHDIGKLHTRSFTEDGQVHFFKHDEVGAYLCDGIFHRLVFPESLSVQVRTLVLLHLRPGLYTPKWSDNAVRRLLREAGSTMPDLLALARADNTTKRMSKRLANLRNVKALRERCEAVRAKSTTTKVKLPRGLGHAIQTHFEMGQGPQIGKMVDLCYQGLKEGKLAADAPVEAHLEFLRNELS